MESHPSTRLQKLLTIAVFEDGTADITCAHWDVKVGRGPSFAKHGSQRTPREVLRDVKAALGVEPLESVLTRMSPSYGSEHCICGPHATPARNCPVHWALAAAELEEGL